MLVTFNLSGGSGTALCSVMCIMWTYIELNDPEQSDKEEVKGHKKAEGSSEVRDALLFRTFIVTNAGRHRGGVDGAHFSCRGSRVHAAALTGHGLSHTPGRTVLSYQPGKLHLTAISGQAELRRETQSKSISHLCSRPVSGSGQKQMQLFQ